jgi:hypothetical protein
MKHIFNRWCAFTPEGVPMVITAAETEFVCHSRWQIDLELRKATELHPLSAYKIKPVRITIEELPND